MNKKLSIFFLSLILFILFFLVVKIQPGGESQLINDKIQEIKNVDHVTHSTEQNNSKTHNKTQIQISNFLSSEQIEDFEQGIWPGYGKELSDKLNSKDPRVIPSINDYPIDRQKQLLEQLETETRLGYTPVAQEEFINREIDIKSNLFSTGNAQENSSFDLSHLPEDLSNSYLGFTMEDALPSNNTNFKSNAIRRVFELDDVVISLEEVSATNGTGHFIKEFVTNYIGEYPAVMGTMKKGHRQFEQLIWDTDKYRYALYGFSKTKSTQSIREQLLKLAQQITEMNNN